MEQQLNGVKPANGVMSHDKIRQHLEYLRSFVDNELAEKKETIKDQAQEIQGLNEALAQKEKVITILRTELKECQHTTEGNRQLINKLLGDISRLQNDVDWYKRTYETRSFLGTVKEKIKRLFS